MHDLPLAIGFLQPANDQGAAATCIVHYLFPDAGVAGAFSAAGALGFGWITMRTLPPSGVLVPLSEFSIANSSLRLSYEMKAPLATSVTFVPSRRASLALENSFTTSVLLSYSTRSASPSTHRSPAPSRFWRKVASLPGSAQNVMNW